MRFAKLVIITNDRIREVGRFTDENACTFIVISGSREILAILSFAIGERIVRVGKVR